MSELSAKEINKEVSKRKKEILEWLKSLIRFPSENRFPAGSEGEAQKFIEQECKDLGLETDVFSPEEIPGIKGHPSWLENRDYSNDRKNVVARWRGKGNGCSLLLSGHIDVAPFEPDNWKICSPYEPVELKGRLYGRGAMDMKGGLAAEYWAIKILKDMGIVPHGDIIFESVVDEEFAGGNGTLASRLKGYNADLAILTEPTGMDVCTACLGAFLGDMILKGSSGMPFLGDSITTNPVEGISRVIELFKEWENYWDSMNNHALFQKPEGRLKVLLWDISSKVNGEFSQMGSPPLVRLSWVTWSYPGTGEDRFYKEFRKFWNINFKKDPVLRFFNFEINPSFHYVKPWETDADNINVMKFLDVYADYFKKTPEVKGASISCDMAIYGEQGNMPVIIMGPRGGNIHSSDEWVLLEDIYSLTCLLAMLIKEFC